MDELDVVDTFDNAEVAMVLLGASGKIISCNLRAERLFGCENKALQGLHVSYILPNETLEGLTEYIIPSRSEEVIIGVTGRHRSGILISLSIYITSWVNRDNVLQYILVIHKISAEITAAKVTLPERSLSDSAIQVANIGVFECYSVKDTVTTSSIWHKMLEINESDAVDVQKEWRKRVHIDDIDAALKPVEMCLNGLSEQASCEYRVLSKDRSRWNWFRDDVAVGERDASGMVISVIGTMTNISERKTVDESLRRSEEQFKSAFESSAICKAVITMSGKFTSVNSSLCDTFGYSEVELLNTDLQMLIHCDDLEEQLSKIELLREGVLPRYQIESRFICKNSCVIWGIISIGVVKGADAFPEHFIVEIVNVSEQRRLREIKNEFVATVSHELRTPLTSILGALSLISLTDVETLSEKVKLLLDIAQKNGKRLHELINDILDFESLSNQEIVSNLSEQVISELVEEAVLANYAFTSQFRVCFNVDCSDKLLIAYVNPKRFQQIMANLLSNAAKFSYIGTTIEVVVRRQKGFACISVVNEGSGIPDSFRQHIFRPFSQAEPADIRSQGGTGLGLNIAKKIVEQMGGNIGFESVKGKKTTFWFTAPLKSEVTLHL